MNDGQFNMWQGFHPEMYVWSMSEAIGVEDEGMISQEREHIEKALRDNGIAFQGKGDHYEIIPTAKMGDAIAVLDLDVEQAEKNGADGWVVDLDNVMDGVVARIYLAVDEDSMTGLVEGISD